MVSASPRPRQVGRVVFALSLVLVTWVGVAAAHTGGLGGATRDPIAVPTWLFLLTGGGVVGVSFLLASFVTDRRLVGAVHDWGRNLPTPGLPLRVLARVGTVAVLVVTVAVGYLGPATGVRNLAVLVVWVAWWGGYVASTYLVGNTWPTLSPFRAVAEHLPSLNRPYPDRLGAWPSVAGLLLLVWVEVMTPIADDPRLLSAVLVAYTAVTLAGSVIVGVDDWFGEVDPVARVFRFYGSLAPVGVVDGRLRLRLPGGTLPDAVLDGRDDVAFVVTLLFVTTYDGFVATGLWAGGARTVAGACRRLPRRLPRRRRAVLPRLPGRVPDRPPARGDVPLDRLPRPPVRARAPPHCRRLPPRSQPRLGAGARPDAGDRGCGAAVAAGVAATARRPAVVVRRPRTRRRPPRPPARRLGGPRHRVRPVPLAATGRPEPVRRHRRHGRLHHAQPLDRRGTVRHTPVYLVMTAPEPTRDTRVPPDAAAHVCDRCERPFVHESQLALHRGLDHADDLSPDERAAFETAREEEVADLRRFRLLALAALVFLYFGFLMTYAVVT
jgi:hypothetical protein